jgi:hypothetical protein
MNLRCEIELQMRTMLKFKYYGHHSMSRKFKYRYIERSLDISFAKFISDIKLIHGTYRNFTFTVKQRVRKIELLENKKGESKRSDSPSNVVIPFRYPKRIRSWYLPNKGSNTELCFPLRKVDITSFFELQKPLISWRYIRFKNCKENYAKQIVQICPFNQDY